MLEYTIEIIRAIILIIASALILTAAIGILRLKDEMDKVIYVRIHILGVMDIASVLALIGLNQPLLAGVYFVLAPFLAHAMANAYYYGEDGHKYNEKEDNEINKITNNVNNLNDDDSLDNDSENDIEIKNVNIDDETTISTLKTNEMEAKHD